MRKIECIIHAFKLESIQQALSSVGVRRMTVTETEFRGFGRGREQTELYRSDEYTLGLAPKLKVEIVVPSEDVDKVVEAVKQVAATDWRNRLN